MQHLAECRPHNFVLSAEQENSTRDRLHALYSIAFTEDPHLCLAIIFLSGRPRNQCESGKRQPFFRGMLWLFNTRPQTFFANLDLIHTWFSGKTLLDLLMFVMHQIGANQRRYSLDSTFSRLPPKTWRDSLHTGAFALLPELEFYSEIQVGLDDEINPPNAAASTTRLRDMVAELFAEGLKAELHQYRTSPTSFPPSASFATNAPSPRRMHDRATSIVDAIVDRLFPASMSSAARKIQYQQRFLTPLRAWETANPNRAVTAPRVAHALVLRDTGLAKPSEGDSAALQCNYCKKFGHWKANCPGLRYKDERAARWGAVEALADVCTAQIRRAQRELKNGRMGEAQWARQKAFCESMLGLGRRERAMTKGIGVRWRGREEMEREEQRRQTLNASADTRIKADQRWLSRGEAGAVGWWEAHLGEARQPPNQSLSSRQRLRDL